MITEYQFNYQVHLGHFCGGQFWFVEEGSLFVHRLSVFLGNLRLQKNSPPTDLGWWITSPEMNYNE